MKHVGFAIVIALISVLSARDASAAPARTTTERELGIEPSVDVSVASLAVPSDAHPWGTVAIAWAETDGKTGVMKLRIGEWDLVAARFLHIETLRTSETLTNPLVRLVRSDDVLVLAAAGFVDAGRNELLRLDLSLRETDHLELGEGWLPSLAASGHLLAFGTYEHGSFKDCSPYHVRLVDLATFTVVAARKFDQPLCPWPATRFSTHALRFDAGGLLVILAERFNPRIARLSLPSLATAASVVVPIPDSRRWGLTSAAFSPPPSALAIDVNNWGCAHLSSTLRLASTPCQAPPRDAPDEPTYGEQVLARFYGHTIITGVRRDPKEADKDESEQVHTRWVIRVAP